MLSKILAKNVVTVITMFCFNAAYAQLPTAIAKTSIGFLMGIPVGKSTNRYINGYGISVKSERNVAKSLNVIGSVGYMTFRYRDDIKKRLENLGEDVHVDGVVPITIGGRYYFGGIYYAALEAGTAVTIGDQITSSFSYAPGIGVYLPFSSRYGADIGLKYERWRRSSGEVSFVGIRFAFALSTP
ncbi:hypothetical protein [Pedobacter duraquae]|uniref:Outer membrane protein with beta-barrel domain n=1 Tax=Pedobacter duraquae TaxID=425511 RepID=A0A4R6IE59_9SPHI|nr:hypothetical protein [Pedobacter duraquae]TDO20254.1 hypothetical protein CLV32_4014 [Pedobacter duraquae]